MRPIIYVPDYSTSTKSIGWSSRVFWSGPMKEQRNVETVEDFKLRIAAMRRASPELIPPPRRMNPVLVRPQKRPKRRARR